MFVYLSFPSLFTTWNPSSLPFPVFQELKLAYNAGNQAAVAAANILLLVQGKSATKTYTVRLPIVPVAR